MAGERLHIDARNLISDYRRGLSENRVAKKYGISRIAVRKRLIEAGVHIRGRSEAETLKWTQMNTRQRRRQVRAAHNASRGRKAPRSELRRRAKARERGARLGRYGATISPNERKLKRMLARRGIATVSQQAIGTYNCDLGADPVAVEVLGGQWHSTGDREARTLKRIRYFLDRGWHVVLVVITTEHRLSRESAEYIATFVKRARRNPSMRREYRMIWCRAELLASGSVDDDEITLIPPFTRGRNALGRYCRIAR